MALYADIIIDISLEKLDRTFQYLVPEELEQDIGIGMPIEVPFGKGSRRITGYVVNLTTEPSFDPAKIKPIFNIKTDGIPIEAELISLAAWMRKNYGGTMNQALKTVLPIKRKENEKQKQTIALALEPQAARTLFLEKNRKNSVARERLLEALIEQGELPKEIITKKLGVSTAVIHALEEQGIVKTISKRDYRNPVAHLKKSGNVTVLNAAQQNVVDTVWEQMKNQQPKTYLLHGVTGSGKTEVYMELIARTVAQGKQAIVLIPEIALTYQTVMRFYNRFGERVSILNSRLSLGERFDQYQRAKNGEIDVMIGPRSALFTPFSNLGIMIIDEEHETSYKSETVPRYHAREVAAKRAELCGATLVLGSATPSLESYYKAKKGEYTLLELTERVQNRPLPVCHVIDLRDELKQGNRSILSVKLQELMEERLHKGEQMMLFLNRRGLAGFVSCRACGNVIKCPHCDVALTEHNNGRLVCHYCGYEQPRVEKCPVCGSPYIGGFKAGTQQIEQVLHKNFPKARILRMDYDTTRAKGSYEKILSSFAAHEADILVGTQMIVKGHDFPDVTLVGALAADLSLNVADYRCAERTFQLLTQAVGRSGRGTKPGEAIIQSYHPDHYSIQAAAAQDYEAFYQEEMAYRMLMDYPPAAHMLSVLVSGENEELVEQGMDYLAKFVERIASRYRIPVIGPAYAAVGKVNDIYRKVLYLKHRDERILQDIKDKTEKYIKLNSGFRRLYIQFDYT